MAGGPTFRWEGTPSLATRVWVLAALAALLVLACARAPRPASRSQEPPEAPRAGTRYASRPLLPAFLDAEAPLPGVRPGVATPHGSWRPYGDGAPSTTRSSVASPAFAATRSTARTSSV